MSDTCTCRKHGWDPDCEVHGRVEDDPLKGWVKTGESLDGKVSIFNRDPGDETGYEPDDPKHPTYHDRMADIADHASQLYPPTAG